MKKIFFICLISFWGINQTHAQLNDTTNINMHKVDANSLLKKSKNQKTAAWILVGAGTGLAITGFIIEASDAFSFFDTKKSTNNGLLIVTGSAAMVASIPFFIAARNNKNKANLMLKNETIHFNPQLNKKEHMIAIGLKINL